MARICWSLLEHSRPEVIELAAYKNRGRGKSWNYGLFHPKMKIRYSTIKEKGRRAGYCCNGIIFSFSNKAGRGNINYMGDHRYCLRAVASVAGGQEPIFTMLDVAAIHSCYTRPSFQGAIGGVVLKGTISDHCPRLADKFHWEGLPRSCLNAVKSPRR